MLLADGEPLVLPGLVALHVPGSGERLAGCAPDEEIREAQEGWGADGVTGIVVREADIFDVEAEAQGVFALRPGELIAPADLLVVKNPVELILRAEREAGLAAADREIASTFRRGIETGDPHLRVGEGRVPLVSITPLN